jgi:peroxiredoxin
VAGPDPLLNLPANLPVPVDDGATKHLQFVSLPRLSLPSTKGREVSLRDQSMKGIMVVFAYPLTGVPGKPTPPEWDAIPGARGCTPEACAFRDLNAEFEAHGAHVFGLSTQTTEYQKEMAQRLELPYEILSDHELRLQKALNLPTFEWKGQTLFKRHTIVARGGRISKVFYPVFPPDKHPQEVVDFIHKNLRKGT